LGAAAMATLEAIGRAFPLDVFGLDFDVDDSGSVVFFEANASMNLFPHPLAEELAYPPSSEARVSENDINKIEAVAWEWAKIADECDCAAELVHHARKTGGAEVTAEDARGASALSGKCRSVRVLNRMSEDEGERAGVDNHKTYFRVDDGKPNMAPPSDATDWYRLASAARQRNGYAA